MARRPSFLQFGSNDVPPLFSLGVLSVQHTAIVLINLVYVLIITKALGISGSSQLAIMAITLLAAGMGSIVQAAYGSRLLIVFHPNPIYIPLIIAAGLAHGASGIAVLVATAGILQFAFGSAVSRLRVLFPPEVCGVVVIMLGITLLPNSLRGIVEGSLKSTEHVVDFGSLAIAVLTLSIAAACSVWLKGTPRFFSIFIACLIGMVAAYLTGHWNYISIDPDISQSIATGARVSEALLNWHYDRIQSSFAQPLFALPEMHWPVFAFDKGLILIAAMAALVNVVDELGVLIGAERLDDADWRKPDFKRMSRGLQSSGLFTALSGIFGGIALGMSSANLSLAYATGVTSRFVAIATGALLITVAFMPKVLFLVTTMPDPVLAGVLFYAAAYFIVSGCELAMSRMMSPRRALVIGVPVGIGIILQSTPALHHVVEGGAYEHLFAPMTFATLVAILLNFVMRINISQKETLTVKKDTSGDEIYETLERLGETWGLHRITLTRASSSIRELAELFSAVSDGDLTCTIENNDLYLFVTFNYSGEPILIPDKAPATDELLNDPKALLSMSGWIIKTFSDRVHVTSQKRQQEVRIGFEC